MPVFATSKGTEIFTYRQYFVVCHHTLDSYQVAMAMKPSDLDNKVDSLEPLSCF